VALQTSEQMGYASPATIRSVISRFRDQGLPQPLTPESILRIGVTESLAPRTIQTLKLLGLIDQEGIPSEQFERLRRVPTSEFKAELASMLRSAYAPVFEVVEPAGGTYEDVQDAFRTFKPEGQRDRMVALFLGLLEYAEYSEDLPSGRTAGGARNAPTGRSSSARPKKDKPSERQNTAKREPLPPAPPPPARSERGERVEVRLGSAGSVVAYVDVRWLELPAEKFTGLREAIESIKALGYEDLPAANKNGPSGEGPSGQPSGDGGGVTPT
jgi:hypothetical protein